VSVLIESLRHTRGSRATPGRTVPSTARRRTRLRAAFLALVWALPAVCCSLHVLAHDFGHGVPDAPFADDRIVGMSGDHDHRHAHLDSPSAISTEGVKKLDGAALLIAAANLERPRVTRPRQEVAAISGSARTATVVSGPRAPPIS
jgi:hypothetical protein